MPLDFDELTRLVTAVTHSPKYRHVAPDLVAHIGAQELEKRRSFKDAVKATKNKLHQVGGAYQDGKIDYDRALALVDPANLRDSCRDVMRLHRSTAERLSILELFYETIFAELPEVRSVLDVACGLNPLALPWMRLPVDAMYTAVDIYSDMMAFLDRFFVKAGVNGRAMTQDVVTNPPTAVADVAFVLKTLPVLEQIDKTAVPRLLDRLNARHLVISFPLQSLTGRKKGMKAHYGSQFATWCSGRSWGVKQLEFETELVFVVETPHV